MKNRGFIVMIALLSALVIAVTIGTIVVGTSQFDGVVTERPYEAGLAWDEVRKKQQNLGWKVIIQQKSFSKGTNNLSLTILGSDRRPLENAKVLLTVSRPASRNYDHVYETRQLDDGRYTASIDLPLLGHWDLRADIRQGAEHMDHRERIYAQE